MNAKAMLYFGIVLIALGTLLVHLSTRKANKDRISELEEAITSQNKELEKKQDSLNNAQEIAQQRIDENNLLLLENERLQNENNQVIRENRKLSKTILGFSSNIEKISSFIKDDIEVKNETISLKEYSLSYLTILEKSSLDMLKKEVGKEFSLQIKFFQLNEGKKVSIASGNISNILKEFKMPPNYDYGLIPSNTIHLYSETNELSMNTLAININMSTGVFIKNKKLYFEVPPQQKKFLTGFPDGAVWLRDSFGNGDTLKKDNKLNKHYFLVK